MKTTSTFWKDLKQEVMTAAAESPRLFFAPLVGAVRSARVEWNRSIQRNLHTK
jgi:hypothetical protein